MLRCPGGGFTFHPYLNLLIRYPQGFLCPSLKVFTLEDTVRDFTLLDLVETNCLQTILVSKNEAERKSTLPAQRYSKCIEVHSSGTETFELLAPSAPSSQIWLHFCCPFADFPLSTVDNCSSYMMVFYLQHRNILCNLFHFTARTCVQSCCFCAS